jgi:hypothetical protein
MRHVSPAQFFNTLCTATTSAGLARQFRFAGFVFLLRILSATRQQVAFFGAGDLQTLPLAGAAPRRGSVTAHCVRDSAVRAFSCATAAACSSDLRLRFNLCHRIDAGSVARCRRVFFNAISSH